MTLPLCIYKYLEDNTTYGAKYTWYNGAQNKIQKPPKTWNTAQSLQQNAIVCLGFASITGFINNCEISEVLKLKT